MFKSISVTCQCNSVMIQVAGRDSLNLLAAWLLAACIWVFRASRCEMDLVNKIIIESTPRSGYLELERQLMRSGAGSRGRLSSSRCRLRTAAALGDNEVCVGRQRGGVSVDGAVTTRVVRTRQTLLAWPWSPWRGSGEY